MENRRRENTADTTSVCSQLSETAAARQCQNVSAWRKLARRSLWLLSYPIALITINTASAHPDFVEKHYSSILYPALSHAVGTIFSLMPFSVAEYILYTLIALLIVLVVFTITKALKRSLALTRLLSWVLIVFTVGGLGLNAFYWMWGFNYFRGRLADRLDIDTQTKLSPEELKAMCFYLADTASLLRTQLLEDESGVFMYDTDNAAVLNKIPAAFQNLGEYEPAFSSIVFSPKAVTASQLMSNAGIAGIFIPFTEEANVNVDATPLLIASSAAHEAAHYTGIAREEEANMAAFLACAASEEAQIRYSGYMLALIHAGNALAAVDPEGYAELWARYSDGMVRDLRANSNYVSEHEGSVSETANRMNDRYLKNNAQSSGVRSYGEMVDLLGAYLRDRASAHVPG